MEEALEGLRVAAEFAAGRVQRGERDIDVAPHPFLVVRHLREYDDGGEVLLVRAHVRTQPGRDLRLVVAAALARTVQEQDHRRMRAPGRLRRHEDLVAVGLACDRHLALHENAVLHGCFLMKRGAGEKENDGGSEEHAHCPHDFSLCVVEVDVGQEHMAARTD